MNCSNTDSCVAFKCPFKDELKTGKMVCDFGLGDAEKECPTDIFNQCQTEGQ